MDLNPISVISKAVFGERGLVGGVTDTLKAVGVIKDTEGEIKVKEAIAGLEIKMNQQAIDFVSKQEEEITKRWQADMASDNTLSKLVRPMSLIYVIVIFTLLTVTDGNIAHFQVKEIYVKAFNELLWVVFGGYFVVRTVEKIRGKAV